MKKITYNILSHVPIASFIVKNIICDPFLDGSLIRGSEIYKPVFDYIQEHPDEVVTRKMIDQIIKTHSK